MRRIKSVLRSSMAQERMYNLALLNTEQDIVHKMDFTDIIYLFTAAKTRKRLFLFCSKDLQFWISFSSISVQKNILKNHFAVSSIWKECPFSIFLRLLHFQKSYANTKLRFQVGPGPLMLFLRCARAHVVLIRHCMGDSSKCWLEFPPSTSPLPCSEDHYLPLSDCEFSLI